MCELNSINSAVIAHCGNLLSHILDKNLVKATLALRDDFTKYFFGERMSCFSTLTAWKNSSNQLFSNFFSKTVAFTKSLQKKCEREFPHCDTVNRAHSVEKIEISLIFVN